jgi:tripeptidyl-peptidase-1
MSFKTTVKEASTLFDADFGVYEHEISGRTSIRTLAYSIPAELKNHLELVHPMITYVRPSFSSLHQVFDGDSYRFSTGLGGKVGMTSPLPQGFNGALVGNLSANAVPTSCATSVTPACLQALYGIPTTKATQTNNHLTVTGQFAYFLLECSN